MDLNILHPRQAVDSAFEKPSLATALGLVLLAAIVWAAHAFAVAGSISLEAAAFGVISSYIRFFVLAIVLFVIALLLNRAAARGKFSGMLSALSLLQLLLVVLYIVSIPASLLIAPQLAAGLEEGESGLMLGMQAYSAVSSNLESINFTLVAAFLAIGLAIGLYSLYIVYLTARRLAETGILGGVVAAIASTAISGIILSFLI